MIEAAKHITEVLKHPDVVSVIGDKTFWELAEEGTQYPFVNFSVVDQGGATKSGIRQYSAVIRVFAKSLTESSIIGDVIKTSVPWRHRGSQSSYTGSEAKEAFIELNFEFKL